MGIILRTSSFLLVATLCHAKHDQGCCRKIDAINKNALSLEAQCQEIKVKADALVAGGCCGGGGGECVCAPTPIIDGTDPIPATAPGSYCLTVDIPTKDIEAGNGVIIDLNGHTIRNVFGDSNFTVKNGTILNGLAGNNNVVGYNLKLSTLTGGGASFLPGLLTLVDCTGLTELYGVDKGFLVRCSGGDDPLSIHTQSHVITMLDSHFSYEISGDLYLESLKIYRSILKSGLSLLGMTNLSELCIYNSVLGNVVLSGAYTNPVRMLIESSLLGDCEFGTTSGVTNFSSGLVTRSLLGQTLCKKCVGLTFNASEIVGELSFDQCEEIECDTDSVHQVDGSAFVVDNGRSFVVRDCFATVQSAGATDAGYSFNGTTTALNVLNCYAKGCPIGFLINNPTDGFIGVIKECVVDGCSQASYKQYNEQAQLYPYGNVAISKSAVPVANYDANALISFNPLITSLTAIETDTVTSWRNISFELP
jgi:hypothetical protein